MRTEMDILVIENHIFIKKINQNGGKVLGDKNLH